ncbi:MAG: ankyrin repeat domain-containing protein [Limnobacter sp.]|uniref:ankyrin repeat domain-containing protein n=1 Tax=Limnobacter sp. TaxID=2003368 RepID=UPI00391D2BA3
MIFFKACTVYPALPQLDSPATSPRANDVGEQTAASSLGGGNQPSRRLAEFKTGLNVWVNQASNAERTGRLEAVRRIQNYLDKGEKSPHLDLSKLSLSTLPNDVDVLAMVAILRGAVPGSGVINLTYNPLDISTRQVLAQQPEGRRDVFQVSVPEASNDAAVDESNTAVAGPAPGGSSHVAWICNLTNVVGVLQDHTLPALESLAKASVGVFNNPISTLSHAVSVYTQQRSKALSEVGRTNLKNFTLSDLADLNLVDYIGGLERLNLLAEGLRSASQSLTGAEPSLAFRANPFTKGNSVNKAKDKLLALGGTVKTIEHLLTALHEWPGAAKALLEQAIELDNRLDDLQRRSLQLEVRGESAGDSLTQLAGLLIDHTRVLGALYREIDQQVGQYKNLAEQLPAGWPLKAHLQQWLQGKAEAVADLQQHKNLALLLGRLANPRAGSDVQAFAHTRLAGMVSTLPAGSPYLELLAKHPNEQVRGLVPALVPAVVPEPTQPTQPATDLAPAGLKRTPSETALAQFPAVNVPDTALAKVRYTAPAFEAVKQGDLAKLHEYLSLGLNPLVTNDLGQTLLHMAAQDGQVTVLRWLATVQKLPLEVGDRFGSTPLHVAAEHGQLQAMAALVDAGADKHAKDEHGNQAIHLAAEWWGDVDAVKFCRNVLGQSLEARAFNGRTPLVQAAGKGNLAVMRWLVAQGAEKHAKDNKGNQAIHLAATFANADAVKFCRDELGQSIEARGSLSITPLSVAAMRGNLEVMRWLVAQGADKHAKSDDGNQAIHLAATFANADAVKFCRDELGQSIEARGSLGITPLLVAAMQGNLAVMRWLVAQGADKHAKSDDGNQAIHLAALFSNADAVKFCRDELGQSLEARGFNGRTPLLQAAETGNLAVMRWLVGAGANPRAVDSSRHTLLDIAKVSNNAETIAYVEQLLSKRP